MSARERSDIFTETAARMNIAEAIVEKDFWVCWVLKQLFSIDSLMMVACQNYIETEFMAIHPLPRADK